MKTALIKNLDNGLVKPEQHDDVRSVVGYIKGKPAFIIAEHADAVLVVTPEDPGFERILKLIGVSECQP